MAADPADGARLDELVTELASDPAYATGEHKFPRKLSLADAAAIAGRLQDEVDRGVEARSQRLAVQGLELACCSPLPPQRGARPPSAGGGAVQRGVRAAAAHAAREVARVTRWVRAGDCRAAVALRHAPARATDGVSASICYIPYPRAGCGSCYVCAVVREPFGDGFIGGASNRRRFRDRPMPTRQCCPLGDVFSVVNGGIMFARRIVLSISLMAFGCAEQPNDTQEIIDNLIRAGFSADDIQVVRGVVYTGRDAVVSLAASREMVTLGDSREEQYRTTNLISTSLTKICVNGSTFTGVFSTALDLAIQNYDELPLTFAMARTPSAGCGFTINAVIAPGVVGGSSGFPSGGVPFPTINIGDGLSTFSVDTIEHVITHEIGHTIGFRHSDFFNRTISCGTGGNEGDAGVGAILIPGTPSGATVGGSIMNSCFRSVETGEFTATDLTALYALYAGLDNIAFQANTSNLWIVGPGGPGDTGLGMMPGTSPSITKLATGGYEVAFQANTGNLWVTGAAGTADTGLGMRAGTSPSIAGLAGGGYEVAFQANTTNLWVTGTAGTADTGLGMAATTSPSITGLISGGYQVAFQANTTALWTTGTGGTTNTGLGMLVGTSPSIARLVTGGFQVAFQANTTELWTTGTSGTTNTGLGMLTGTSPSITGLAGGGFEVAFQANTTRLWFTGAAGTADTGLGMLTNTSPSIAARPGSGFDLVFQANTSNLWTAGSAGTQDLGLGMAARTSPSTN